MTGALVTGLVLLCAQSPEGGDEARALVERLSTSLTDISPATFQRDANLRRLVVLDLEAVPALERGLDAADEKVRVACAIALNEIGETKALHRRPVRETDPRARLLMSLIVDWVTPSGGFCGVQKNDWLLAKPLGLDEHAVHLLVMERGIEFAPAEARERCRRLLARLDAWGDPAGRDLLSMRRPFINLGTAAVPMLVDWVRSRPVDRGSVVVAIALFRIEAEARSACEQAQRREAALAARDGRMPAPVAEEARWLAIDHVGLLDVALSVSAADDSFARLIATGHLAQFAWGEAPRLAGCREAAEARLRKLAVDPDSNVRTNAAGVLARLRDTMEGRRQGEENRAREMERQDRVTQGWSSRRLADWLTRRRSVHRAHPRACLVHADW